MKQNASNERPVPERITHVRLSDKHVKLRTALLIALVCITLASMLFGLNALIGAKAGMQEITLDATGAFECCKYFTFYYDIGADGSSPAAQKKALRSLYSKAVTESYQLFCADAEYEDVINLSYINSHPNTDIKVPHALYEALSTLENSGTRYHYLAPAYELYASLFRCSDDEEAASYDPAQNAGLRAFFIQCAAYANDPACVGLDLLGDDTMRLSVSDEYMRFALDNAISRYIDLLWLKNAFCTDYIAAALRENGYTRGTVISYDGFICHLGDAPETRFDYTFSHRQGNVIANWKTLSFAHPVSIVYLHDYPFGYEDEDNYYVYGSGETVFPFVDVTDGMYKCAVPEIVACSSDMSLAELALSIAPVFIADTLDAQALDTLESGGIDVYVHP